MFMQMYLDLMSEMALYKHSFIVVKSDVSVLTSHRYYMRFLTAASLVMRVSIYYGLMSHTDLI